MSSATIPQPPSPPPSATPTSSGGALWYPEDDAQKETDESSLRVDGHPGFGRPMVVQTTRERMRSLIRQLRGETQADLVALSNERYRAILTAVPASVDDGWKRRHAEAWERACGNVLVVYAVRWILDGRGIPVRVD